jgi:DNA-binding MarR family transcriptional regulator
MMGNLGEAYIDLYISNKLGDKFNSLQFDNINNDYSTAEKLVLCYIYRRGKQKMGDIASNFNLPFSSTTVLVDKLVRNKMLKREHSKDDRRVVLIDIDKIGISYVEKFIGNINDRLMEVVKAFESILHEKLPKEEMQTFYKVLDIAKDFLTVEK